MSRNYSRESLCYPLRHDCWGVTLWSGYATKNLSVTGYHDAVLVPEVALVPLPLFLVDKEGFKRLSRRL